MRSRRGGRCRRRHQTVRLRTVGRSRIGGWWTQGSAWIKRVSRSEASALHQLHIQYSAVNCLDVSSPSQGCSGLCKRPGLTAGELAASPGR